MTQSIEEIKQECFNLTLLNQELIKQNKLHRENFEPISNEYQRIEEQNKILLDQFKQIVDDVDEIPNSNDFSLSYQKVRIFRMSSRLEIASICVNR